MFINGVVSQDIVYYLTSKKGHNLKCAILGKFDRADNNFPKTSS